MINQEKDSASSATWFVGASCGGTDAPMPRTLPVGSESTTTTRISMVSRSSSENSSDGVSP